MSTSEALSARASDFVDEVIELSDDQAVIPPKAREEAVAAVEAAMQRLARAVEVAA